MHFSDRNLFVPSPFRALLGENTLRVSSVTEKFMISGSCFPEFVTYKSEFPPGEFPGHQLPEVIVPCHSRDTEVSIPPSLFHIESEHNCSNLRGYLNSESAKHSLTHSASQRKRKANKKLAKSSKNLESFWNDPVLAKRPSIFKMIRKRKVKNESFLEVSKCLSNFKVDLLPKS